MPGADAPAMPLPRIDGDLHRPRQPAVADDAGAVLGAGCPSSPMRPLARGVVSASMRRRRRLDVVAVDRAAGEHHLEAVVVLRVVAAGDLDAARCSRARRASPRRSRASASSPRRGRRRRARSRPGRGSAPRRAPGRRCRPSRPTATAALAGGERLAAEGAAEVLGEALVDRLADDAADVVGLEDRSVNLHREERDGRNGKGAGAL